MEEGGGGNWRVKINGRWQGHLRKDWQAQRDETPKHREQRGRNETGQTRSRRQRRKPSQGELGTPGRRIPAAIFLPYSSFLWLVLPLGGKQREPEWRGTCKDAQVLPSQGGSKRAAGHQRRSGEKKHKKKRVRGLQRAGSDPATGRP